MYEQCIAQFMNRTAHLLLSHFWTAQQYNLTYAQNEAC